MNDRIPENGFARSVIKHEILFRPRTSLNVLKLSEVGSSSDQKHSLYGFDHLSVVTMFLRTLVAYFMIENKIQSSKLFIQLILQTVSEPSWL